jgi:3-hydroxyacyl-CoA dehydrogenase
VTESAALESLHLTRHGPVAVVELDNPPVNALFDTMRDDIATLMAKLDADASVGVILIVGAGPAFCAGVDLKKTGVRAEPFFFHAALDAMDRVDKPIGAAVHGPALGGGCEVAITCHYRAAAPKARFGLPEVEVGIIPGACGTQRLPRLVPIGRAIEVAALGDMIEAPEAFSLGLVDTIIADEDFRTAAIGWAATLVGKPVRRTRDLPVINANRLGAAIAAAEARIAVEKPGEAAPAKALEAVIASAQVSFDEGVEVERRIVTECKYAPEAKAMRHLFFAERAAGKIAAAPSRLAGLAIDGLRADALTRLAAKAGIPIGNGLAVSAVAVGEAAGPDRIVITLPDRRSGIVEITMPASATEGDVAAVAKLVRGIGRATVIGRGRRISDVLASVVSDPAALADAAERLVSEGVAASAGDVDLVCVGLLGFPKPSGGPTYMRSIGLA